MYSLLISLACIILDTNSLLYSVLAKNQRQKELSQNSVPRYFSVAFKRILRKKKKMGGLQVHNTNGKVPTRYTVHTTGS